MLLFEKNEERFFYGSSDPSGNVFPHGSPAQENPNGSESVHFHPVALFQKVGNVAFFGFSQAVKRAVRYRTVFEARTLERVGLLFADGEHGELEPAIGFRDEFRISGHEGATHGIDPRYRTRAIETAGHVVNVGASEILPKRIAPEIEFRRTPENFRGKIERIPIVLFEKEPDAALRIPQARTEFDRIVVRLIHDSPRRDDGVPTVTESLFGVLTVRRNEAMDFPRMRGIHRKGESLGSRQVFPADALGVFGIFPGLHEFHVGNAKQSEFAAIFEEFGVFSGRNPGIHGALHALGGREKLKPLGLTGPKGKLLQFRHSGYDSRDIPSFGHMAISNQLMMNAVYLRKSIL